MSYDTKYRPRQFKDVIGQETTISLLKKLLSAGEIFQKSYVFAGPSGTGKTTLARILARAMLCDNLSDEREPCNSCPSCVQILERGSSPAFQEMDAANNTGADNIRQIVEGLDYYTLGGGDRKIYLIDEAHRLSVQAMDALLKPMEDSLPGQKDKRLVCLFCTTEPQKLRGTIKSRCMVFGIRDPERDDVIDRLRFICEKEEIEAEDEALNLIFDYGRGHIRDMVSALERVSRVSDVTVEEARAQLGLDVVAKQYEILLYLKDDPEKALTCMSEALTQTDADSIYRSIAEAAMAAFRSSKGINVGLSFVERDLAAQIAAVYGEDTLLAVGHRILSNPQYRLDTNALTCELLVLHSLLSQGVPLTMQPQEVGSLVPEKADDPEKKGREDSSEPLSDEELVELNRKMAGQALKYGAQSARGKPDVGADMDPLTAYRTSQTRTNDSGMSVSGVRSASDEELKDMRERFKK